LQIGDWQLRDVIAGAHTLFLIPPGAVYAVHVIWGRESKFVGWYVNLQEPLRRTAIGFDFMDPVLDIVVKPDLSEWTWKDQGDLQRAHEMGLFSARQARAIRAEGERVVERIRTKASPFSNGWEHWAPPEWPIPESLAGWDKL